MKNKSIRIIDIAKMAKVSPGTVDRVLHNRGRVSIPKKESVEKVLKEINYEPNMVARFLASKRTYNFVAITPLYNRGDYWELICNGINKAADELNKFNVTIDFVHFDQYDRKSFLAAVGFVLKLKYDGIIIATLFGDYVTSFSQKLDERQIPYIYIDCNIENQNNLSYLGVNGCVSGRIAAKLLLDRIGKDSRIIFTHIRFKHGEISVQMQNREEGFLSYLNDNKFTGTIVHMELNSLNAEDCLEDFESELFNTNKMIGAIVLNSRIYELVKLLDKLKPQLRKKIHLIGYDAIPANVEALKLSKIEYLISQRTDRQGYDALKLLANHLLFNQIPEKVNFMPIDILIRENIDYYNNSNL